MADSPDLPPTDGTRSSSTGSGTGTGSGRRSWASTGPALADVASAPVLIAVPNVSEGRDRVAVGAIGAAYVHGGARLLDTHSDPDHHRAVHTVAGRPGELAPALAAGAAEAIARIDLRRPRGIHPHVGALDVCPVVYLDPQRRGAASLEALVAGELLGRLGLPVFLYGDLGGGRTRADLRRGGTEGLAERLAAGELHPDFGPRRLHPTAGAVLVGARAPLLAFNIELAAPADVDDARRIAALVREGGKQGLPGVRAIGLALEHPDGIATGAPVAQVSCNVEDHRAVALATLVAAIARHADIAATEVVGLPPAAAFDGFPSALTVRGRRTLEAALGSL